MKKKQQFVYICKTDLLWSSSDKDTYAPIIYRTVNQLKSDRDCWKQCGIVKIELSLVKEVSKGKTK